MGRNKHLRERIAGLERSIQEHEAKVREERSKACPDEGDLAHWQTETEVWKKQFARLTRRLKRDW